MLFQNLLPVRRPRLLPQRCFIVAFHQARCTSADLILPWRSSSAKSIYKDFAPSRYPRAPPRSFRRQVASVVLGGPSAPLRLRRARAAFRVNIRCGGVTGNRLKRVRKVCVVLKKPSACCFSLAAGQKLAAADANDPERSLG